MYIYEKLGVQRLILFIVKFFGNVSVFAFNNHLAILYVMYL